MKAQLLIRIGILATWFVIPLNAALVDTSGSFNLTGTNFPVNFGVTSVPLDGAVHSVAGGQLNVQAEVIPVDINREWLQFNFATPSGALAGDLTSRWDFTITDIQYTEPVLWQSFFYYWSIDGAAVTNIDNWAGGALFPPDGTNPIDASLGKGYGGTDPSLFAPFNPSLFIQPFSFIATSVVGDNLNPALVNDFHVAALVVRQQQISTVPEPATCLVWSVLGLVGVAAHRRRGRGKLA